MLMVKYLHIKVGGTYMSNNNKGLWQTRINDYRASNKSGRQWCNENNIPYSSLKYWITKFNKEQAAESLISPEFVPISTEDIENRPSSSSITIRFGKVSIDIAEDCRPSTIKTILEVINAYV